MGIGVWGLGFGVWGLGFGVWGLGFGVWGLRFAVCGLGFGVWGLGFGFWGFGLLGGSWVVIRVISALISKAARSILTLLITLRVQVVWGANLWGPSIT